MFEEFIFFIMKQKNSDKIKKDYEWVLKVLKSSKNFNHIVVSDRMIDNFLYKWRMELNVSNINEFKELYTKEKKVVSSNFSKKLDF